jgi:hypothetical protein
MSVTNFVNLSSGLPGQSATQHAQPSALPANPAVTSGTAALPKDQFVPSSLSETTDATAHAAGLFTVSKSASSSASSDLLSTPSGASSAQASSPTKTNLATAAIGANVATGDTATSASSSNAGALSGSALPPTAAATSDSAAVTGSSASSDSAQAASTPATTSSSAAPSGSVTTQTQLDSLNNALQALGLSAADIQQVDQVAQLTNDFSPTSFTSLVYQLEALARNSSPQTQSPPAANASTSSNNAAAQPAAATSTSNGAANAPTGASATEQTASGGGSSSNNKNFSLQSAQLQLNFTNGDGQSLQVQTPVLNSNSAPAVVKTQAATA